MSADLVLWGYKIAKLLVWARVGAQGLRLWEESVSELGLQPKLDHLHCNFVVLQPEPKSAGVGQLQVFCCSIALPFGNQDLSPLSWLCQRYIASSFPLVKH